MILPLATIGLFSDAHYAQLVYADRHCDESLDKLSQCVAEFVARRPDFVVNLGDFIDKADRESVELRNLDAIRRVFEGFSGEKHHVLGNHDVGTLNKETYLEGAGGAVREPFYAFDRGLLRCLILDSNCHEDGSDFAQGEFDWDNAWVSPQQVGWLREELSDAGERPVVVFCHGNLDGRRIDGKLDPHVVRNSDEIRKILETHGNVVAVVQGHYHPGFERVIGGIPYIGLRAMVVGSGLANNSYGILSVYQDGRINLRGSAMQPDHSFPARAG